MSIKKVSINNLSKEISNILENYQDEIDDKVIDLTDNIIKDAKTELKEKSPVGQTGEYAKSWTISIKEKGIHFYSKAIWNKKHYRLTHLLEFGHATVDGNHTPAQPHIRPVEEKYKEKFIDELESEVRR